MQSQYELARLLLAEGDQRNLPRGRALLAEAREGAQAMGLAPLLRAIDALRS